MAKGPGLGLVAALAIGLFALAGGRRRTRAEEDTRPPFDPNEGDPNEGGFTPDPDPPTTFAIQDWVEVGNESLPEDKYYPESRDMRLVNTMVLHGMGFDRGTDVYKYRKVNAHFIILSDGQIAQLHPLDRQLMASNSFNKFAVSVEFTGNHRSSQGNCYKPQKFGCHEVSKAQILAGRYLIDQLIQLLPKYGGAGLQGVYAHRQASPKRGNDPGPEIWYGVGNWADQERGLYTGQFDGYKIDDGRAIPESWTKPPPGPAMA